MIEIEKAWELVDSHLRLNAVESLALCDLPGRVVAQQIVSDSDSPPFSKSLVDGFAVGSSPIECTSFTVAEIVTAGHVPSKEVTPGFATQIMTGAPIPKGTVGVVMVEETEKDPDGKMVIRTDRFTNGQNILKQADVVSKSQVLACVGHRIQPHHIGAFAEFGTATVDAYKKTEVAILATGDELVAIEQKPGPGQIRNSNGPMLTTMAKSAGANVTDLGIGRDVEEDLKSKISQGLNGDILVVAGGVSAGVLDLVPKCLSDLGVKKVFHKINLKPGKPLWFGVAENGTLVFGLPGNPVSALVCFKLFVHAAIRKLEGDQNSNAYETGVLASDFDFSGGRRTFWPSQLIRSENPQQELRLLDWVGSADQVRYLDADVLVELDGLRRKVVAGEPVRFVRLT